MDEKKILSLSREELLAKRIQAKGISYKGCFISDIRNSHDREISEKILKYPYRIESFFLMICKRGSGSVNVNLQAYKISDNSLFFNLPNSIIQINQKDEEMQGVVVGFDEELAQAMNFDIKNILPIALSLKEQPIQQISEQQCDQLISLIKNIALEIQSSNEEPFHDEIIRNYFSLFFYKLCSIMSMNLPTQTAVEKSVKSRNEEYFHRFMQILSENYKRERSLGFYASQLCITPKYLTTLIKRVSGHTAAEWIDQYVILEAKNLLRYSTKSIQEVAYELNFPNQSFFGKYFKHLTGYSPSAYKLLE